MSCQVTVKQGALEGKICSTYSGKKYYSFEGIPYAKPPLEELRFRDPQEPECWSGIRDATKPGNRCAQLNRAFEGSEDCLYLNIYTPSLPEEKIEKLPIIFFIHGGRLVIGYGDYYKPDYLIRNDVILVTINYRLNVLGFLCLDTPDVPGNAGLKDTVFAMRWVKNNIKQFNGDANNITVMGESAGAAVATSYMTSDMTKGLANKIICQTGTSISDLYIVEEDPIDRASKIASFLGHDTRDKTQLHDIFLKTPVEELVYAFASAEMSRPPAIINSFLLPVIEKRFDGVEGFFLEQPFVAIRENRFEKVPILNTLHSHESALFLNKDAEGNIVFEENFQYFIPRYLFIKHNTPRALKFAHDLREYYFNGRKVTEDDRNEYLNLVSDFYFNVDIILFLELLAKFYKDVYVCRFGYTGNMNTRVMKNLGFKGATHGDLIQYIFYRENKAAVASEKDNQIVDMLTEAWCNFAKTGKPSWSDQQFEWLPYTREERLCLNVEDEVKLEPMPNYERIKFWFNLLGEKSKL